MAEHALDDVRLHAEIPKLRSRRSAQIMKPPRLHGVAEPLIEVALGLPPRREPAPAPLAEQRVPADEPWRAFDKLQCERRQRQAQSAAVLGALLRQLPHPSFEVDL